MVLQYNFVKDLLLPNTVNQKDEKPHTAGLDDTAMPRIKIKITETDRLKKLNTAITLTPPPPSLPLSPPLSAIGQKHSSWALSTSRGWHSLSLK